MAYHVNKARFGQLVEEAIESLPEPFAEYVECVSIEVRDRSTPTERSRLGMPGDRLLLGLYTGRPLTRRSVEESGSLPDVISLFQEDIENVSHSEAELVQQVRITLLHEIGHYFGLNERQLDELGFG